MSTSSSIRSGVSMGSSWRSIAAAAAMSPIRTGGYRRVGRQLLLRRVRRVARKAAAEDILVRITAVNRANVAARCTRPPSVRNTWPAGRPTACHSCARWRAVAQLFISQHPDSGRRTLRADGQPALLFTENETNARRLFDGGNTSPFVKDGINDYVVGGAHDAVNPARRGTRRQRTIAILSRPVTRS